MVSEDELEAIHQASLTVLRDTGMDFLHPTARRMWADAGARLDGDRVRLDPDLVTELVALAPAEFVLHAPDPARHVPMGGRSVAFSAVASPPNVADRPGGRRTGNREDYRRLVMLAEVLNSVSHTGGYPVEPVDVHSSVRHLVATRDLLTLSRKAIHCYSLGAQRNQDCLEMVRIVRGVSDDDLEREPSIFTVVNCNSPLRLDTPMLEGILQYSARNQVVVVTPFTLAGAMAPVTVAGAVVQQNAEALAGIAFTQLVRPGSPAMYGASPPMWTCSRGRPPSALPSTCRRCCWVASWPAAMASRTDPPMRARPTRWTPRPPTRACSRCGPWSWAAPTW